jgi:predicted PurR-regulated permease PerM
MITVRRSLRRAWQIITWTLSGHIIFALATGIACGIVAARYPEVIWPPYAAIFGTLVVYPVMVAMWWRLHPPGGNGR